MNGGAGQDAAIGGTGTTLQGARDRGRDGDGDDGPSPAVGPGTAADPLAGVGYRRPSRTRILAGVAAVAILGVTGVTGTLVVIHDHQSVTSVPATTSAATNATSGIAAQAGSDSPTPLAAQWSSPVPVDQQILQPGGAHITGLACPKRTVCYATDSGGTVLSLQSGGTWPVANTDPNGHLIAISCPSARFCLTVDAAGDATPFDQGAWGAPALVGSGSGTLTSVSCVGPLLLRGRRQHRRGVHLPGHGHGLEPADGRPQRAVAELGLVRHVHGLCGRQRERQRVQVQRHLVERAGGGGHGQDLVSVSCPRRRLHGGGYRRPGGRVLERGVGAGAGRAGRGGVLPAAGTCLA